MKSSHCTVNAVANNSTRRSGAATGVPLEYLLGRLCRATGPEVFREAPVSPALQTSFSRLPCQDTALTHHLMCWTWSLIPTAELEAKSD